MKLLNDIHSAYEKYSYFIKKLEEELYPYLCEYLKGENPHIFIREDEGGRLFILDGTDNYELDKEHIEFIKQHKRIKKRSTKPDIYILTQNQKDTILRMWRSGVTTDQCAKFIRVERKIVRLYLVELGLLI